MFLARSGEKWSDLCRILSCACSYLNIRGREGAALRTAYQQLLALRRMCRSLRKFERTTTYLEAFSDIVHLPMKRREVAAPGHEL